MILRKMKLNDQMCEIACYGRGDDWVCRITPQKSKPKPLDMTDGYSPPNDDGLLWIRAFQHTVSITGYVRKPLFPSSVELDSFLDRLQELLPIDEVQPAVTIDVIGQARNWLHCFNGEQMDTHY